MENVPVIERVIDILSKLKEYVRCVDAKKVTNPVTKSFEVVRSACRDSLLKVKLHFILSVAKRLQPFLKMCQVDKPMMPFLVPDLLKLVKDLLARFVQRDVVESLVTCSDVIGFDTNDTGKHCLAIELGFSADKIIPSASFKEKKVSDRHAWRQN